MSGIGIWLVLIPVSVAVFFLVLLFIVACLEKHPVAPFGPADFASLPDPSPYFQAMNEFARQKGFIFVGAQSQKRKSGTYQCYLALWISPDGKTLVRISGGKTAKVAERRTFLVTCLQDNHIIESVDYYGSYELSGVTDRKLLLNANLDELCEFHQNRLAQLPIPARVFDPSNASAFMDSINEMRARRLVELGLAEFTDKECTVWVYTISGAIRLCATLIAGMDDINRQQARKKVKRPGD